MRNRWVLGVVSEAVIVGCAPKQVEDELLDRMVGEWDLTRSIRGTTVKNTVSARWVLGHQFVR